MELHEHDKYNGSLRARKSWFFFDNRIVCMGSDIENKAEGGVHTTLFQNFLADAADPLVVNGEAVTQFPYRAELAGGAVLRDNLRNAYFVPKGRVAFRNHFSVRSTRRPTPRRRTISQRRG